MSARTFALDTPSSMSEEWEGSFKRWLKMTAKRDFSPCYSKDKVNTMIFMSHGRYLLCNFLTAS